MLRLELRQSLSCSWQEARRQIVAGLQSTDFRTVYCFEVRLDQDARDRVINDPAGDQLDALLCAIQAAWAYGQRANGYGIPRTLIQKRDGLWIPPC